MSAEPSWTGALPRVGRLLSAAVDPVIAASFARSGFRVRALAFDPDDLDVDLRGRRCLVTGANSGLGFELARGLAERGAEVVLLCRDEGRAEAAVQRLRTATANAKISQQSIDLSSLASVRAFARRWRTKRVDVLVHNAGLLPDERVQTKEGFELTTATHVVGPHLLTKLLRGNLAKSEDARVVWVSSGGMYARRLNLRDPNWTRRDYDGTLAYAETKRAQIVLSELWAQELRDDGIAVNAMHPGWAETPGVEHSLPRFFAVMKPFLRTAAEGADTALWLAIAKRARETSGAFFLDREPRRTHYLPSTRESGDDRQALWEFCERAAG